MADQPVVHIGENSPEQVAFRLLQEIARAENKSLHGGGPFGAGDKPDRKWLLDTYAECLDVVQNPSARGPYA